MIIDDANPLELRELLITQKADLLVAGVKERFLSYKLGIAFCDFNHDRTTSFEGFDGMVTFAREVDLSINSPVWKLPVERPSPTAWGVDARSKQNVQLRRGWSKCLRAIRL